MADAKTEKQKVKEITDKLEEGLKELFESGKWIFAVSREKDKNNIQTFSDGICCGLRLFSERFGFYLSFDNEYHASVFFLPRKP